MESEFRRHILSVEWPTDATFRLPVRNDVMLLTLLPIVALLFLVGGFLWLADSWTGTAVSFYNLRRR